MSVVFLCRPSSSRSTGQRKANKQTQSPPDTKTINITLKKNVFIENIAKLHGQQQHNKTYDKFRGLIL